MRITAITIGLIGLIGWFLVAFMISPAIAAKWLPQGHNWIPTLLLPIPGLLLGLGAGYVLRERDAPQAGLPLAVGVLLSAAVLSLVAIVSAGAESGTLKAITAALTVIFGTLTLLAGGYALEALRGEEGAAVEGHWGGLGGGLGGWRLTSAAALALMFTGLISVTVLVAIADPDKLFSAISNTPADTQHKQGEAAATPPTASLVKQMQGGDAAAGAEVKKRALAGDTAAVAALVK